MRRIVTIVVSVGIVLVLSILFAAESGSAKTEVPAKLASNKAAAKADAGRLLTEVALPSRAQKISAEPAGDHGYLRPLAHLSSNPGFVDTAWWRASSTAPDQVIAAVKASPPSGVAAIATGGGGNTRTGTRSTDVTFFLRSVPRVLQSRMVEVTATALAGGDTGVMVQTQSQWVVPRSAASIIPADTTHVINVSETTAQGKVLLEATVTAVTRVRATVAYFNGLESGQPGTTNCPGEPGGRDVVTVKFLAKPGAAPVATASFSGDFEQRGSGLSSQCSEVELRVGAGGPVGLLGGNYIFSVNRLLGTRIP